MSKRLAAPLAALGLFALTACGGGSTTENTVPADADVVVRAVEGVAWDSKAYTATADDGKVTIYAVNDSSIAHNMYVLGADDAVIGSHIDLAKKGSDGTAVYSLTPGDYRIVCKVPGHASMNSSLTVD